MKTACQPPDSPLPLCDIAPTDIQDMVHDITHNISDLAQNRFDLSKADMELPIHNLREALLSFLLASGIARANRIYHAGLMTHDVIGQAQKH